MALMMPFEASGGYWVAQRFDPTMSNENQHLVPKFLVKNFVDRHGRVFCLDIHTDQTTKPPPTLV